mgnify:CR=1 FL=1
MTWEQFERAATVGGVIALGFGVVWYVVNVETRIQKLEAQLQAIGVSPALNVQQPGQTSPTVVANPLMQTCADLANRAAAAIEKGNELLVAFPIQQMMDKLGCKKD